MMIVDIGQYECDEVLRRARLGRLACCLDGQPYVTPLSIAHDDACIYGFSTVGQKIRWMRANPRICLEVEELETAQRWTTVIVTGKYEELAPDPAEPEKRERAYNLLKRRPVWWEPGYVKTVIHGQERPLEGVYFRMIIDNVSGHRGVPDTPPEQDYSEPNERGSWLTRIFQRRS